MLVLFCAWACSTNSTSYVYLG